MRQSCKLACFQDQCKGDGKNGMPRGVQWESNGIISDKGCCSLRLSQCEQCCPPKDDSETQESENSLRSQTDDNKAILVTEFRNAVFRNLLSHSMVIARVSTGVPGISIRPEQPYASILPTAVWDEGVGRLLKVRDSPESALAADMRAFLEDCVDLRVSWTDQSNMEEKSDEADSDCPFASSGGKAQEFSGINGEDISL